ncbi:hypothetical protein CAPTEDRAFT_206680 [Capitella teleta]|uniref:G-protein coupled receptors family 1 profile domain-containing protein n=1 Tax=Capitella teleta TaxID=283909 RepID=R7UDL5_CAPTE|nr:hypothetical protein CAPTEDRAFT_206680 [Capitella teleta]|eukprot:ELU04074.1 hypothetical protein CAPTEDRAFT_206680 [Capitella teleta]
MATPALESFCCMFNCTSSNELDVSYEIEPTDKIFGLTKDGLRAYNIICIISSLLGIGGATYQLWPRPGLVPSRGQREITTYVRQRSIICYLALADLFAAIGIMIRSTLWISGFIPLEDVQRNGNSDFAHIFCSISTGLVQYFFICTYCWTFCYALDTYLLSMNKKGYPMLYHMISWVVSAVICGTGLVFLYYPNLLFCVHSLKNLLPHYLVTYIPILLFMILNPFLYSKASTAVEESLRSGGLYTNVERLILTNLKKKFLFVVLVFYFCWLPNVLNGVLLIFKRHIPSYVYLALWQYMAVVNPVQALLNCLVYRNTGCCMPTRPSDRNPDSLQAVQDYSLEASNETSHLLVYRR